VEARGGVWDAHVEPVPEKFKAAHLVTHLRISHSALGDTPPHLTQRTW